jgi:prephenate dehydrogenase
MTPEPVGERPKRPRLLVVGAGLIGTSLALAARAAGYDVWLDDRERDRLAMAVSMAAGRPRDQAMPAVDVAVAAVPPAAVASVVRELSSSGVAATITHTASVQYQPQVEIEASQQELRQFVGSHPIAGRERSGPHHASAELFTRRPWIVCPTQRSAPAALAAVVELATACGGIVTEMSATEHDALFAQLSHVPQLLASGLAGSLQGLGRDQVALAGTGLRDTTRLADSDPSLWAEIVAANAQPVAAALREVLGPLNRLIEVLDRGNQVEASEAVGDLIGRGRQGRALLAGKHGHRPVRWASVSVVVPDEPGALAQLLVDAAQAQVNVEDIRVDHSPGQPFGIVELDVAPARGESLEIALRTRGWTASTSPAPPD